MYYFTSDWHFDHHSFVEGGHIPIRDCFKTVDEMNSAIISAIKKTVDKNDVLVHCGDLFMGTDREKLFDLLDQIPCRIELVYGNHDGSNRMNYLKRMNYETPTGDKFTFHEVGMRIKHHGVYYHATHYPMMTGDRKQYKNICGHIHTNVAPLGSINVGIDSPEIGERPFGQPVSIEEVAALIEKKSIDAL